MWSSHRILKIRWTSNKGNNDFRQYAGGAGTALSSTGNFCNSGTRNVILED
jgi:hypothetical protein